MKIKSFLMAIACIVAGAQNVSAQVPLTVEVPEGTVTTKIQGDVLAEAGGDYYIMNVATGKYLKAGANYGTRAVEGSAGMLIKVKPGTEDNADKWTMQTFESRCVGFGDRDNKPYMDRSGEEYNWSFDLVTDETDPNPYYSNMYYISCYGKGALCSTGQEGDVVVCEILSKHEKDIDRFKWVLLSEATMKAQMQNAVTDFDCTPLLKAADFDYLDFAVPDNDNANKVKDNWSGYYNIEQHLVKESDNPATYATCIVLNSTYSKTISQNLTSMPSGRYTVSFQGFYRCRYAKCTGYGKYEEEDDHEIEAKVTFGTGSAAVQQEKGIAIGSEGMQEMFRDGAYTTAFTTDVASDNSSVTLSVVKPQGYSDWRDKSSSSWICIDNIKIMYRPSTSEDATLKYRIAVANKINDTWNKVKELGTEGNNAYSGYTDTNASYENKTISAIISNVSSTTTNIDTQLDVDNAFAVIDAAYEAAVQKYKETIKEGSDATGLIDNHSFETGNHNGWTLSEFGWNACGVYPAAGLGTVEQTPGADGSYVFNTWSDSNNASVLKQTITGLPKGLYELTAKVTAAENKGQNTIDVVYLFGNKSYAEKVIGTDGTLEAASVKFLVDDENGTATIGAVGASVLWEDKKMCPYFVASRGGYFKADDFHLTLIEDDAAVGRMTLALAKAKKELSTFTQSGKDAFTIDLDAIKPTDFEGNDAAAQSKITEIEDALTTAAKAQTEADADMTRFIKNPSFEDEDISVWNGSGAVGTEHDRYDRDDIICAGCDSWYLFNSWNDDATHTSAGPVSQIITGLPEGTYTLSARMASDNGNDVYVSGKGIKSCSVINPDAADNPVLAVAGDQMYKVDVDFYVEAGDLVEIVAGSTNNASWYKVDDFRLTYHGPGLVLREDAKTFPVAEAARATTTYTKVSTDRRIPANKWSTFVLPYEAKIPDDLEVRKFASATENAEGIAVVKLEEETAEYFTPGVPYMVKPTQGSDVEFEPVSNANGVTVSFTDPVQDLTYIEIYGTYVYTYVPVGAWFISGNKYWDAEAKEDDVSSTKLKGFRAYIKTTDNTANVKGVKYVFAEDPTTGIDAAEIDNDGVVAVFGLDGRRLTAPQRGVNIVKMSDGTTQKVLVK